jgi:hypothetical protein
MDCDDADDAMRAELQSFGQGSMTHPWTPAQLAAVQSAASHFEKNRLHGRHHPTPQAESTRFESCFADLYR